MAPNLPHNSAEFHHVSSFLGVGADAADSLVALVVASLAGSLLVVKRRLWSGFERNAVFVDSLVNTLDAIIIWTAAVLIFQGVQKLEGVESEEIGRAHV